MRVVYVDESSYLRLEMLASAHCLGFRPNDERWARLGSGCMHSFEGSEDVLS